MILFTRLSHCIIRIIIISLMVLTYLKMIITVVLDMLAQFILLLENKARPVKFKEMTTSLVYN